MDDFWTRRYTALRYDEAIYHGDVKAPVDAVGGDALFEEAAAAVGVVTPEEAAARFDFGPCFHDFEREHVALAVGIGAVGAGVAVLTDLAGPAVEKRIIDRNVGAEARRTGKTMAEVRSTTHPADFRQGAKHRYLFGHDMLNPWQRLPEGFLYGTRDVGGRTLADLCAETYGLGDAGLIGRPFGVAMKLLRHYLSDLPTPDGLPLPSSSLFTRWEENVLTASGFSGRNELMSRLGREFGTVHLSDVSSTAVIWLLVKLSHASLVAGRDLGERANAVLRRQLGVVAYGTGMAMQLGMGVVGANVPSAKMNWALAAAFLKNTVQLTRAMGDEHRLVTEGYQASLDRLRDSSVPFDAWVDAL